MQNFYYEPKSLKEASEYLKNHTNAIPIAGGTDVVVRYNKHVNQFDTMVNIKNIVELDAKVSEQDGYVRIGTLIKHNELAATSLIQKYYPALIKAVTNIGTNQIRNLGTIGGNICNASPCADSVAILTALGASIILSDGETEREVALKNFFIGPGRTVKEPWELLTCIHIPVPTKNERQYFEKIGRRKAAEISVVNIGMVVKIKNEIIQTAEMVLGSVGPKIVCPEVVQELMLGKKVEDVKKEEIIEGVIKAIKPISDVRASAQYRVHVTGVLVENALNAIMKE